MFPDDESAYEVKAAVHQLTEAEWDSVFDELPDDVLLSMGNTDVSSLTPSSSLGSQDIEMDTEMH